MNCKVLRMFLILDFVLIVENDLANVLFEIVHFLHFLKNIFRYPVFRDFCIILFLVFIISVSWFFSQTFLVLFSNEIVISDEIVRSLDSVYFLCSKYISFYHFLSFLKAYPIFQPILFLFFVSLLCSSFIVEIVWHFHVFL